MKLEIEYVLVRNIKPYAQNTMKHSHAQIVELAKMIKEYGFVQPVLLDEGYNLIAGHGRIEAAILNELTEVPAIFTHHLSERQVKALRIADNKISRKGKFDFEMLALEMAELSALDFDLELTGFDEQEIDALLKDDVGILPKTNESIETKTVSFEAVKKPKKSEVVIYSVVKVICPTEESEAKLNLLLATHGFQTA